TAAAGAVAARHLGPRQVTGIGICGSGVQARLQALALKDVTPCRDLVVWARDRDKAERCAADLARSGFLARAVDTPGEVAAAANLIVTATAASAPYLRVEDIRAGTHITAMGSDTPEKNELQPGILAKADVVAADSAAQCR